jgi:hypothetical protein
MSLSDQTRTLYRPVGLKEMKLILESESTAFPPRLKEQPIFYPVLNLDYAKHIARDWNTKDAISDYAGYVTQFDVDADYIAEYEEHIVGGSIHKELWIPAVELSAFNKYIVGKITIQSAFFGDAFKGAKHFFKSFYADGMLLALHNVSANRHDFSGEITMNRHAIPLNFPYWVSKDFSDDEGLSDAEKSELLQQIDAVWRTKFPDLPLCGSDKLPR